MIALDNFDKSETTISRQGWQKATRESDPFAVDCFVGEFARMRRVRSSPPELGYWVTNSVVPDGLEILARVEMVILKRKAARDK